MAAKIARMARSYNPSVMLIPGFATPSEAGPTGSPSG